MDRSSQAEPRDWSEIEKCLLWLGIVLGLYTFYLYRVDTVLAHPAAEPYFNVDVLSLYRQGLFAVTLVTAGLFLAALAVRHRSPENPLILHAANQIWWVWTFISAYFIGPLTSPILALVMLGGFFPVLLFSRRFVMPAVASGMLIFIVTTVAERAGLLPYAPLFTVLPGAGGQLPTPYVLVTSASATALIVLAFSLLSYLVERGRSREHTLLAIGDERKKAGRTLQQTLESLRSTEERFRQLAENSREVFWLMDLGGRLLYVSPTFERMWGTSLAALYERTERFLDAVHPEDRARVAENMQSFRADIPADFTGAEIEYRLLHPNGDMRWVRVRAFPVRDAQNQIFRMGGLIDDITEQKAVEAALIRALDDLERRVHERTAELLRSNESLRVEATERKRAESALRESETRLREQFSELENLYRHAPIGLCLHDTEMRYVRINERLAAINGHPASAHIGRTLGEMAPEMEATVGPIIRRVLETGESALDIELQSPAAAEPEITRSWLTSYYPLTSSDGRTLGVSAVVQDISEIKWAEDRARQHLENLAHVSRLSTMGQMATGLAHEINQPLATITNYAFAGRRKLEKSGTVDTAEIHQLFDDLLMQALRAGEIVQHLRAFVNKAPQRRTTTSVNTLIRDVLDLMESQFRLNDVRPVPTLDAGAAHVSADAIQIQQVIVNLIRNALDAMATVPPRDRQLAITSTCADKRIEVAVRDSGTGLSSDELAHVFEAFYSTKGEGMGMGLAISRSIIEAHGGRLWAEANPNKGMVFRFTLPETRVDERKEV